jgi:hypothetical protein
VYIAEDRNDLFATTLTFCPSLQELTIYSSVIIDEYAYKINEYTVNSLFNR